MGGMEFKVAEQRKKELRIDIKVGHQKQKLSSRSKPLLLPPLHPKI
jgi:hypothetical protein